MALAERLKKPAPTGVYAALDALDNEDRAFLLKALHDQDYRHVDIADALQAEGYYVTADHVRKYRLHPANQAPIKGTP